MKRVFHIALIGLPLATLPNVAYAYIDPGLLSVLVQGFFALIFGSAAAYLLAPWRRIKAFFGVKAPETPATSEPDTGTTVSDLEDASSDSRP